MSPDLKSLAALLRTAKTPAELQSVIFDLFTEAEIKTCMERWHAVELLLDGATHRSVQQEVGISISKVTHAANMLKGGGKGVRLLYSRLKRKA